MVAFTLHEAQIYRSLVALLGSERVLPNLSVLMVCGGKLPIIRPDVLSAGSQQALGSDWASKNRCLFTIIDNQDIPKVVIDILPEFGEGVVDVEQEERARILEVLFALSGIRHVLLSELDCQELMNPSSGLDLVTLLQAHLTD